MPSESAQLEAGPGPGLETNEQSPSYHTTWQSRYEIQAHQKHAHERQRIINALILHHRNSLCGEFARSESKSGRLADRIDSCCRYPLLHKNEEGDSIRMIERRCRSRMCPLCSVSRSHEVKDHIIKIVDAMDSPRMLTLTLKSSDQKLSVELSRLTDSFKKLRRGKPWQNHLFGGVWVLEVTLNESTGQWHPHIHAIVDGEFWDAKKISAEWLRATGDSKIVHIKVIPSRKQVVSYVSKYVAKGCDTRKLPSDRVAEYALAVAGQRLIQTFGKSHAIKKPKKEKIDWTENLVVNDFQTVLVDASKNEQKAIAIYETVLAVADRQARQRTDPTENKLGELAAHVLAEIKRYANPPPPLKYRKYNQQTMKFEPD